MSIAYRKLISDTVTWLQENQKTLLVSPLSYNFFFPTLQKIEKPSLIALVFYSPEEHLFYEKLKNAIEQHLSPACLVDASQWKKEKEKFHPKWILATREISGERSTPMIHLSAPDHYQNNPEAKKKLWKMLCQTLTLPQSS